MGKHQFAKGGKCAECGQVAGVVRAANQHEAARGRGVCEACLAREVAGLTQALSGEMPAEGEPVVAESATPEPVEEVQVAPTDEGATSEAPKRKRSKKVVEPVPEAEVEPKPYERGEPHGLFLTRH